MSFADLSDRAQVNRLRAAARRALEDYPVEPIRLRLLQHDFNTTFRLDAADGSKFAVRIDLNRRKPVSALDSEMAWLAAIDRDTDVRVPVPLATRGGALHVPVDVDGLDATLHMAVMSWLPGRDLDVPTVPAMSELGRQTAQLHEHAASWQVPPGIEFPSIEEVLMDSPDRLRTGHELISADQQALIERAFEHIEPRYGAMIAAGERMPIHGDLHPWNVKWLRGRMSIFDFDDAGIGVPAQDLAISTYYLSNDPGLREALLDGYQSRAPLPPFTDEQFHAALASRTLLLLNDLLDMTTNSAQKLAVTYLGNVELRLWAYLDSGVYRGDVPGVVPLG